jgi:hypothetical protein
MVLFELITIPLRAESVMATLVTKLSFVTRVALSGVWLTSHTGLLYRWPYYTGVESSQQPLGGEALGLLLWITWVQTGQSLIFSFQRTPGPKFSQGQNAQSQEQKPD